MKEAPALIDHAILRGWITKPKTKMQIVDGVWHTAGAGHLDNASEDEIQKLREQFASGGTNL